MYRFFISLIFCLLFVQNTFSSEIEAISNNTKQNIDNLSLQLKYLVQDHQDNKKEINNILNLYYQHHEKIQAFEIVYKNKYIYSSYKNDSTIIINDDSLFFDIKENLENPNDVDSYFQLEKTDFYSNRAYAPDEFPNFSGQAVEYVIITNQTLAEGFQEIADWKTRKGVPAFVRAVA